MIEAMQALVVFGAETHPPDSVVAKITVPIAILVFFGSTYLLLRANLGTKRGYLVLATTFFGFIMLFSLFWGFGGWGTPPAAGPTQLPGQPGDELQPKWVPFAQDSRLASQPNYEMVKQYPEGFQVFSGESGEETLNQVQQSLEQENLDAMPAVRDSMMQFDEQIALIEDGVDRINDFFAQDQLLGQSFGLVDDLDKPVEIGLAQNQAGELVMAVTYQEFNQQEAQVVPDGETHTGFGFYKQGAPLLPSFVMFALGLVLFVLHAWLLDRDERLERRERERLTQTEEPERVPEPA